MKNGDAPKLFDERLSGPEALAMLDLLERKISECQDIAKHLRAGLADMSGMDKVELPKTADPVRAALVYFDSKHKQTIHAPASIAWGKDNVIMRRIVSQYNGQTERLIDEFFALAGHDDYLDRMGYTPQSFAAKVPALLARLNLAPRMAGVTRNTADNTRTAERAANIIRQHAR